MRTHGVDHGRSVRAVGTLAAGAAALFVCVAWSSAGGGQGPDPCRQSADAARKACRQQSQAEYWLAIGKCDNLSDPVESAKCRQDALDALQESQQECNDQYLARHALCERLGGGFYEPDLDPADFVAVIDNPWLPLIPGTTLVYASHGPDGLQREEVHVTDETEVIEGVACTVVHDVVTQGGEPVEDTLDWYAQDTAGNVWYFGELSVEYEDGHVADLGGTWRAGVGGALPGIVMLAHPNVGAIYRQEYDLGNAEDVAAVFATGQSADVPYGRFRDCVETEDFSPLEPGVREHKLFAQGIGSVLELNPSAGERLELVDIVYE